MSSRKQNACSQTHHGRTGSTIRGPGRSRARESHHGARPDGLCKNSRLGTWPTLPEPPWHNSAPDRDGPASARFATGLNPMTSPGTQKRLPRYALLHDEPLIERYAESTRAGVYNLHPSEIFWRERQPFLSQRGYNLRKRYSPDWKPSWDGTNLNPIFCEDFIVLTVRNLIQRPLTTLMLLTIISRHTKSLMLHDMKMASLLLSNHALTAVKSYRSLSTCLLSTIHRITVSKC